MSRDMKLGPIERGIAVVLGNRHPEEYGSAPGKYENDNDKGAHVTGLYGAIAVEKWLYEIGAFYRPIFRGPDWLKKSAPKVSVMPSNGRPVHIEVTTWRAKWWSPLGRCISEKQIQEGLLENVHVFVWCSVEEDGEHDLGETVTLHGWSSPDDVRNGTLDKRGPRKIESRQVSTKSLALMDTLVTKLR